MIKKIIFIILIVVGAIFGLTVFLQINDLAECSTYPSVAVGCSEVDAIVAISGGDTLARAQEAIDLYQSGWAKTIIFSGAAVDKSGPSNAHEMKQLALKAGITDSAIIIDEDANTTKENAENVQKILEKFSAKKIILVTSGYHQRRAKLTFEKFTDGIEIISHPVATDKDWSIIWWISPRGWWLAGTELIKIIALTVLGAA